MRLEHSEAMMTENEPRAADRGGREGRGRRRSGSGASIAGEHPSPERLLDYHQRKLSPAVADRVLDHLVDCERCSRVVLDFEAFPHLEPPSPEHRLDPAELEERWRDLERAVAEQAVPSWRRRQILLPIAAVFLAAAVGLGLWGATLYREVSALRGTGGGLEVVADLLPTTEGTRGGERTVHPAAEAERFVFVLVDPGGAPGRGPTDAAGPPYAVDLVTADGEVVLEGVPVLRGRSGDFTLALPAVAVPDGAYRVKLYGPEGGARVTVAEYRLKISRSAP